MDKKPSLSQYFGDSDVPPASQFFDEIGTSPSDMSQSVYLGETEVQQQPTIAPQAPTVPQRPQEDPFSVPTISGSFTAGQYSAAVPAASLPDPSTFFDTIGQDAISIGARKSGFQSAVPDNAEIITESEPVDKEDERRRDAWIPTDEAMKTLLKAQSSPKGSFFPEREVLTMPGIVLDEDLEDALHATAVRHLGVSSAGSRGAARAEHVPRGERGVRELLRTGCYRAAANLAAANITAAGQGPGRMHRPTKHTPRSLQNWLTRFAVMVRIKLYEPLAKEAEPFGDLTKPDMFYQFYPDVYENRTGSMAPFSLRLLIAELPLHLGKADEAMDRLYVMLDVIDKMLKNLDYGKTEDGTGKILSQRDQADSLQLWRGRQRRVLHSVVNCALALKNYRLACNLIKRLQSDGTTPTHRRAHASALCRVNLLAGNIHAAVTYIDEAKEHRKLMYPTPDVREFVDLGLIDMALGKYQDAYNNFKRASELEPSNIMVANNISVCHLYMGRLKEAIAVLEDAVNSNPETGLTENLLLNLCTLYELESSKTQEKKLNLLRLLCKHKSDTIPNVAETLKLG